MKQLFKTICLLAIVFFPGPALADEAFTIDHYQVNMHVYENNVYDITEVIDVDFKTPRHGIHRTIPTTFDKRPVVIKNISVPGFQTSISNSSTATTTVTDIRIGSPDKYVDGKISYTISYTYDVGADRLRNMDEFNFNIIGTQWDTTIDAVDFKIEMPKGFDPNKVNCTSGKFGARNNKNVQWSVSGNTITGKIITPLKNNEGLTVALPLPQGYWIGAANHVPPGYQLFSILGYPLFAFVLVFNMILWWFFGRDRKIFPTVEFSAPYGMTPAEIGYAIDGRVDTEDVTSLIIYWAHKGYLSLSQESQKHRGLDTTYLKITKIRDLDENAKSYEKEFFKELFKFGDGRQVTTHNLNRRFYNTMDKIEKSILKSFFGIPGRAIYTRKTSALNILVGFVAMLPAFPLLAEAAYTRTQDVGFTLILTLLGSILFIPSIIAILTLPGFIIQAVKEPTALKIIAGLIKTAFKVAFLLILLGGFGVMIVFVGFTPVEKFAAGIISSVLSLIFVPIMSQRTRYGDKVLEKVLGFQEFIRAAEKDKLDALFEDNPAYFYEILPYAIVLGLSNKWSEHFEGMAVEPPDWYHSNSYDRFSVTEFSQSLDSDFSHLSYGLSSYPQSSRSSSGSSGSSSSGGFSGGGAGGGGGSSW